MRSVRYDLSSVHINLPKGLGNEIIEWGKEHIDDKDLFRDPNDVSFGREDEMHVTILYGLHSESPKQTKRLLKKEPPIDVKLGKIDLFTGPVLFDVVIIAVESTDLERLNKKMRDNVTFSNRYKSYVPHVTIAYVKKGRGWFYKGNGKFEDREFSTNEVVFSSKDGLRESFNIKGKKQN